MSRLADMAVSPGILVREILEALPPDQRERARSQLRMGTQRLSDFARGKSGIKPADALRLSKVFGTSPELWLEIQNRWDLAKARRAMADEVLVQVAPFHQLVDFVESATQSRIETARAVSAVLRDAVSDTMREVA